MDKNIKKLTLSAMFLAMGIILPFFTGQVPQIGSMLLPMHIPVFLCGLICGYQYGVPMAIILPLLRSVIFSRPNMFPEAISIACEMATYAFVAGFLYNRSKWQCIKALYRCMLATMVAGRVIRGVVQLSLIGLSGNTVSFGAFFTGTIIAGIPGIVLQLIIVPAVMLAIHRTKPVPFKHHKHKNDEVNH